MKIKFNADATQDLMNGFHFYERKEAGFGRYFLDSLYSDIDSLLLYSGIHIKIYKKYYRLLSKRFPYAVFYRIDNDVILIDAVIDCRQDPETIEKRFL